MMSDNPTLARFSSGWTEDGISKDGLPHYRETTIITLARPPYLRIEREATDDDFHTYSGPYELFLKEQRSKKTVPSQAGFPLSMWAVVSAAELAMLAAREVYTIEQLAKLAIRRTDDGMPGELRQLAERAKKMIDMSKEVGRFEAMIAEKDGQIEALADQVKELRLTIKQQEGIINGLKKAA